MKSTKIKKKKPIAIANSYEISQDNILNAYTNLDQFFREIIKLLYQQESSDRIEKFIAKDYKSVRNKFTNKTGVYIFLNEEMIPVYIGEGGIEKKDDLKERLNHQIVRAPKDKAKTLLKNIKDIEELLQNRPIENDEALKMINEFYVLVVITGDMGTEAVKQTNALETILIALYGPKYNK